MLFWKYCVLDVDIMYDRKEKEKYWEIRLSGSLGYFVKGIECYSDGANEEL